MYTPEISDCNSATTPGKYACTNASNSPDLYGVLTVTTNLGGAWIFQEFTSASEAEPPKTYIRAKINAMDWTAWEEIITMPI